MCCLLLLGNGEVGGQQEMRRDVLRWSTGETGSEFSVGRTTAETKSLNLLSCVSLKKKKKKVTLIQKIFSSFHLPPPVGIFHPSLSFLSLADFSFGRISRGHDLRLWFKHPHTDKHRKHKQLLSVWALLSSLSTLQSRLSLFFFCSSSSVFLFLCLCTVGGRQRKPHGWAVGKRRDETQKEILTVTPITDKIAMQRTSETLLCTCI